uniref:ABC-type glutathione-S-conjugate transporter n=1 Tax=Erpetoichthys calabaricus TaxID=27687 RepID=A0A8C4T0M2_ERPCA
SFQALRCFLCIASYFICKNAGGTIILFAFFNRIITLGYKRPLQREDLFELNDHDSPYTVCPAFEKHWKEEHIQRRKVTKETPMERKPSLFRALWRTFRVLFIQVFLLKLLADMLAFVSPQVLLIAFCENQPLLDWSGPTYAVVLFVAAASYTLILQVYHRLNMLAAAKIKTAVIGLIYKKALSITNSSRRKFTTGEVVNLMSADAQQLMDMALNMNLLWSAPFQILLAIYFLWKELGSAVMAGLAVLLLIIPLNAFVASRVKHLKKTHMKAKDQRLKLLNEILHGIKILKLYAWEPSFLQKIVKVREGEMEVLKSSGYLTAFSMLTLTCVPFLVSMASFGVFVMKNNENVLTASTVFTSISLFNILRLPLFDLPTVISSIVQTKISLGRLERFICCDELDPTSIQTEYLGGDARCILISVYFVIFRLNLKIADESLVAVVGQVGAGKSSLLSAILGEMEKVEGLIQRKGTVAYVSQQAWIQNATLQENILFGANMIESRYHLVMEACCLLPDLELLPHGDQTEIGERGVNLSGGQKQRVSLARAVYADADIYLLDDPLSAVDVHVGNQLLEKVIGPAGLLKNKTRVLVTNSTVVLPLADQILVMDEGRIIEMGSYEKLLSDNFLQCFSCQFHSPLNLLGPYFQVKGSVILKYLNSFGTFWVTLTMLAYISQNTVSLGQNWLLRTWTDEAKQVQEMAKWIELRDSRLRMYGELGVIQALAVCFGAFVLTKGTLQASRTLHYQMLDSILHLPLLFFETTPIGQLVSRSTKDIYVIDERFHYYLRTWFSCLLDVIGTVVVIIVATPLFAVAIVPLGILYFSIQRYYIASSRQIRRLDGASRSPVISHFSETLLGVSTIRAFGYQDRFISQNKEVIYENLVCYYNNVISNRWLAVRLEFVGNLMIFLAALFMVKNKSHLDSGTVGLAMTYALNITATLNFWVRKACEIETNAVAIERICEYSEMDKEAPWTLPTRPPADWPEQGIVHFDKYEARYKRNLEPALHDVSFQTLCKEKVGIVGRTGAGKSTLTNCLFRILEASKGRIFIDGVDISAIGLHDLREKLNIIPQDPVLFSGTVRENLDPLGSHSDSELWMALELCHLKDFVQSLPEHIHHEVAEGGENLSVGQRQLLCLTRALLRKTKVLILDEATASIDLETDNLVQMTIRKTFSDCTILTIAHRLHTIMDSDRVLVLDSGRVVEFDSPENLLEKGGVFYHMVSEAGIIQNDIGP